MSSKKGYIAWTNVITVIGVLCLIALFIFQWYSLHNQVRDIGTGVDKELKEIKEFKMTPFVEIIKDSIIETKVYVRTEDVQLINENYKNLYEFVQNNTNRAESLIDKDIDRLNLYMAIGIGFMTMLGTLVPIVINFMTTNNTQSNLEELATNVDSIQGTLETNNSDMEKVRNWLKASAPEVKSLSLQSEIGRFFNLSPRLITSLNYKRDNDYFVMLLEGIRDVFISCKNDDNHSFGNNRSLKSTILDFSRFLAPRDFHSTLFDEKMVEGFIALNAALSELGKSSDDNEKERTDSVISSIDEVIKLVKKQHETKSTA